MEQQSKTLLAQPFTFSGVAGLAQARWARLLTFQLVVALLAAGSILTFLELAWMPVIERAISQLPSRGAIQNGRLLWPNRELVSLAGSSFLGITVDPADSMEVRPGADLQVEFGQTELRLRSLLGYTSIPYPAGYIIALNRTELEPWWGAWHPMLVGALLIGMVAGLLLTWSILASVYAWPARTIALYANRPLTFGGAWRLGAAALLPGALFFGLAILAYTLHHIQLVQLLLAAVLHVMIGWVYLLAAPFCLARDAGASTSPRSGKNPFKKTPRKRDNPFADSS